MMTLIQPEVGYFDFAVGFNFGTHHLGTKLRRFSEKNFIGQRAWLLQNLAIHHQNFKMLSCPVLEPSSFKLAGHDSNTTLKGSIRAAPTV